MCMVMIRVNRIPKLLVQTDLSTTFAVYFTLFDNCIAVRGKTNYVRSSSADGLYLYGNQSL